MTATLVADAVIAAQELVKMEWPAAVVVWEGESDGHTMVDTTYWEQPEPAAAFETVAAQLALESGATRIAFAVPLRCSGGHFAPPEDSEDLMIWAVSIDLEHGLDMHHAPYRLDGPTFGPMVTQAGPARLAPGAPGAALLTAFLER